MAESRDDNPYSSQQFSKPAAPRDRVQSVTLANAANKCEQRPLLPHPPGRTGRGSPQRKYCKSRNGCVTCKARRRKCDELKPACGECLRRNIDCGGYRKNIKFVGHDKAAHTIMKPGSRGNGIRWEPPDAQASTCSPQNDGRQQETDPLAQVADSGVIASYASTMRNFLRTNDSPSFATNTREASERIREQRVLTVNTQTDRHLASSDSRVEPTDIMLPRATASPSDHIFLQEGFSLEGNLNGNSDFLDVDPDTFDVDIPFTSHMMTDINQEHMQTTQNPSLINLSKVLPPQPICAVSGQQFSIPMYQQPSMSSDSPETVAVVFDRRICEVLCIKDNAAGNPWRVIIWPLAKEYAAVYHAVAAMTYFQWSNTLPQVRVKGVQHLQSSIQNLALASELRTPLKVSLTARLLLAFAASWYYPRSSCGSKHVQEAKHLLQAALRTTSNANTVNLRSDPANTLQLKFLAKTWLYMDVLTRITCETVEEPHCDFISQYSRNFDDFSTTNADQIDPLMGCAEPLFPLLGQVADLVRDVRKRISKSNSPAIIAHAVNLKRAIENWNPWSGAEENLPEGNHETMTPMDSDIVQTAYAYKWAALLLLYQAVPELPSRLSFEFVAQKILTVIATVPADSKASIFHIFPLMVAGCDTTDADDRHWIRDRWQRLLAGGNSSGISERCLELTSEVWRRRDTANLQKQDSAPGISRGQTDSVCNGGVAVKSRLHWLSVMKDWGWEVLLG